MSGEFGVEVAGVDIAKGRDAARACALNILAQAKAALGSLDRIDRMVKLTGFVNADGKAFGRPVGVAIEGRGALLVADDVGKMVRRVTQIGQR